MPKKQALLVRRFVWRDLIFEFLEFAIENYSEMFGYINTGRVNIRIHRDITGKMWFGVELFVF
ncbi:MAG: hypothetical protein ACYSR0_07480 [Planctomycetota bacterium]|jgi:hypothetical protein